jgi:excisionase family DNA binding protein
MRSLRIQTKVGERGDVTVRSVEPVRPEEADVTAAVAALPRVRDYLNAHPDARVVRLRVQDEQADEVLAVPRGAIELLALVLAHMANGRGVSVVPSNAELTTQQAAELLNVSRPFLIGLLQAGEIEYRLVGKHRRVRAESLLEYIRRDDQRRRQVADVLTAVNREMGLL